MPRKLNPERRAQFLDAALTLFVQNGVAGTSTAAIAKKAGAASGTLFLYFPTKQALIDELASEIAREQSEHIQALLTAPHRSAKQSFFTIWMGSLRWFLDHPDAYHYIQQVRNAKLLTPETVKETEKHFAYYFTAIHQGRVDGSLKPYPVELIGAVLYQDIVAVMELIVGQPQGEVRKQYIQSGFEIFWDGISNLA